MLLPSQVFHKRLGVPHVAFVTVDTGEVLRAEVFKISVEVVWWHSLHLDLWPVVLLVEILRGHFDVTSIVRTSYSPGPS